MSAWKIHRTNSNVSANDFRGECPGSDISPEGFPPAVAEGGFVHLFIDAPSAANALSSDVMEQLQKALEQIAQMKGVEALFLWSSKPTHFIAGANIDEIKEIQHEETGRAKAALGQHTFDLVAQLPFPTFSIIRGTCLGGGLELSLAFDYRIAVDDPSTKIGLPEVNLGIIPGFGGCQRLPRLIGLRAAMAQILAGSRLPANIALRKGVVDFVVPPEGYAPVALRAAAKILGDKGRAVKARRAKRTGGFINFLMEKTPFGRAFIKRAATQQVLKKTGGHYPAALAAIDAMVTGFGGSLRKGLEREAMHIGRLVVGDVCKNLVAIFNDSEKARHLRLESDREWPQHPSVGVLGAGVMGAGIVELLATRGSDVRLRDLQGEALRKGMEHVGRGLHKKVSRRRMTERERDAILSRITTTTQPNGFGNSNAVIEAIVEKLEIKQAALKELEPQLADDALFASNTSALSIGAIAEVAQHPERVVGLHFFNPVMQMPLIEVIPGKQTAPWALAHAVRLAQDLGKYPVVVQDSPGFLVNRLLMPYLDSACRLLERGASGAEIDRIARRFGLPMGPFRLLDEVGIDIAVEVSETLHQAFGDRVRPAGVLAQLLEHGWLGRKSGKGFYRYSDDKPQWNEELDANLQTQEGRVPPASEIPHYLIDRIVDEAGRCLEEGVVECAADVDLAMVMGTGFPPFLGGPLRHADHCGIVEIMGRLRQRAEEGESCTPCKLLEELASAGEGFHSHRRGSRAHRKAETVGR